MARAAAVGEVIAGHGRVAAAIPSQSEVSSGGGLGGGDCQGKGEQAQGAFPVILETMGHIASCSSSCASAPRSPNSVPSPAPAGSINPSPV